MRKRMTSLLLTLVMLLSLVPAMGVTASAAETRRKRKYSSKALKGAAATPPRLFPKDRNRTGGTVPTE